MATALHAEPRPVPLRKRLRDAAMEAMLDCAERAMIEKGYERATMSDIASAAGCATGTFYLYFKNKEELLQAIVARHSLAMLGGAQHAISQPGQAMMRLKSAFESLLRYTRQHRPFFRLFYTALPMRHSALMKRVGPAARRPHDQYTRMELDALREAQAAGQIRADLAPAVLQEFMATVGISIVEQFVFAAKRAAPEEELRILWGLIGGGLGLKGGGHGR